MCKRKSLGGMSNRKQMVAMVGWLSFSFAGTGIQTSSLSESVESCVIVAGATDVLVIQLQHCSSSNVKLTRIIINRVSSWCKDTTIETGVEIYKCLILRMN